MPTRYYLAPFEQVTLANGRRPWASRCFAHILTTEPRAVHSVVKARPWLDWCLTRVEGSAQLHTGIQSDETITLLPLFGDRGAYLSPTDTIRSIRVASRAALVQALEDRLVPMDWLEDNHTIRTALNFVTRYLLLAQMLRDDFPLGKGRMADERMAKGLESTVGDLEWAQRNRLMAWLDREKISRGDLTTSITVRRFVRAVIERRWK